jgi:hypothetical protein
MDKDRIIKRTQLKRNAFEICGKQKETPTAQTDLVSSSSSSSSSASQSSSNRL